MFRLPIVVVFLLAQAWTARAADVYTRYIDVMGLPEYHNQMILARFEPVIEEFRAKGLIPKEAGKEQAKLEELRAIIIDAIGFESLRADYRWELQRMFTRVQLEEVIADLERPGVASVLRAEGKSIVETMMSMPGNASRTRFRNVLHRMRARLIQN